MFKSVRILNNDEGGSFRRVWRALREEKIVPIAVNTWLLLADYKNRHGRLRQSMSYLSDASKPDSYTPHQSAKYGHTMAFPHLRAGPHWPH